MPARMVTAGCSTWNPNGIRSRSRCSSPRKSCKPISARTGIPSPRAMSPLADPNRRAEGYHYEVPPPAVDYAARAIADAQVAYTQQYPDANMNGFMWGAKKVPDGPAHA
jgi:hypothetical protein